MPGRTPEAAVDHYLQRLRRTTSCITNRPIIATGYRVSQQPHTVMFAPRADPVQLRSDTRGIRVLLQLSVDYAVVVAASGASEFGVTTVSYEYRLTDTEGQEILAFHWHPQGLSRVTQPHLHLSGRLIPLQVGRSLDTIPLGDIHIPTGHVLPEDVVRLLIEELGVRPRLTDWDSLLRANRSDALREHHGSA